MPDIQSVIPQNQVDFGNILHIEKWGAKKFNIRGSSAIFHYMISTIFDQDLSDKYLTFFINGNRVDDFFSQFPVYRVEYDKKFFLNFEIEETSNGWKIIEEKNLG